MNKVLRYILLIIIIIGVLYGVLYWLEYSAIQTDLLWNGYVIATNFSSPLPSVTMVNGSWAVPKVTPSILAIIPTIGRYLQWVGIGGYNADPTVIQIGTSVYYLPNPLLPKVSYYAWYETYPERPITISNISISAGDVIYAEVKCVANCSSQKPTWLLYINDTSNKESFSKEVQFNSTKKYGEWIVETVGSDEYSQYLVNMSNTQFVGDHATMNNLTASTGSLHYEKVNQASNLLNVSDLLHDGTGFVVTKR
ncbi:MAG: G1 family glutamic endopeptidase [Candidatus Micrarchaeaceae archaeon]